jgi:hypothetical protein
LLTPVFVLSGTASAGTPPQSKAYYAKRVLDFDAIRIEEMDKYALGSGSTAPMG